MPLCLPLKVCIPSSSQGVCGAQESSAAKSDESSKPAAVAPVSKFTAEALNVAHIIGVAIHITVVHREIDRYVIVVYSG